MLIVTGLALQPERCAPPQALPTEDCAKSPDECRIAELFGAYSLAPVPKLLLEIATLYEKLERPADAHNAYARYLRACKDAPGTECVDVKDALARLTPLTSALQFRLSGIASRVEVDGVVVPAGELAEPVYVMPGSHTVVVTWESGGVVEQRLMLEAGGSGWVSLTSPEAAIRPEPVYGIVTPPSGCACEVSGPSAKPHAGSLGWMVLLTAAALVGRDRKLRAEVRRPRSRLK